VKIGDDQRRGGSPKRAIVKARPFADHYCEPTFESRPEKSSEPWADHFSGPVFVWPMREKVGSLNVVCGVCIAHVSPNLDTPQYVCDAGARVYKHVRGFAVERLCSLHCCTRKSLLSCSGFIGKFCGAYSLGMFEMPTRSDKKLTRDRCRLRLRLQRLRRLPP
jgi:hypothetical protein